MPEFRRATFETLLAIQEVAGLGFGDPLLPLSHALGALGDEIRYGNDPSLPAAHAAIISVELIARLVEHPRLLHELP